MPGLVLVIGGLFIKAFSSWLKLQDTTTETTKDKDKNTTKVIHNFDIGGIASEFLWAHIFGVGVMSAPKLFTIIGTEYFKLQTENSIYYGFLSTTILTIIWFIYYPRYEIYKKNI